MWPSDPLLSSPVPESLSLTWCVHSLSPDAHRQHFFLLFKSVYYSVEDPRSVPATHMKQLIAACKFRKPLAVTNLTILSNVYTHRETYKYKIQSKMKLCYLFCVFPFFFLFRPTAFGFYCRSLGYLAWGSYSPMQCLVWVRSLGTGLKSNPTLVGYCHQFCATTALEYLTGRTDCRWRICDLIGVCIFFGGLQRTFLHQRD